MKYKKIPKRDKHLIQNVMIDINTLMDNIEYLKDKINRLERLSNIAVSKDNQ